MASHDYFMRQIEGMTDVLASLLFDATANEPEESIHETQHSGERQAMLIDLRLLVTLGRFNEAENLLFERMEADPDGDYRPLAARLYAWLDDLDDRTLDRAGFPRPEIDEGRAAVARFYEGRGGVAPAPPPVF